MADQPLTLEPTPYHRALVDYLRSEERDLWTWFASAQAQGQYTESLRLSLLKTTYRLDPDSHPDLARAAAEAKAALGLDVPVTLYQSQQSGHTNATLYFIPGEGHVVFSGPVVALFTPLELRSILGHELAHYLLWQREAGDFLIADRLLEAMSQDPRAATSHGQSARRYRLYTEIFADRGSLAVARDLPAVVAGLVKVETGLPEASGASFLKQADEVFAQAGVKTEGVSHPETFIRARALRLWAEGALGVETQVAAMIEGPDTLAGLDLLDQVRFTRLTRRFLEQLLRPKWFQTETVLGLARLFFNDFQPSAAPDPGLAAALAVGDAELREFFSYLLLDFAVADRGLEDLPLAAALDWGRRLQIESTLERLLQKELNLKARELKRLKKDAAARLAQAEGSPVSP